MKAQKIRLRQVENGRWYKLGTGKPIEATTEEVTLWENAQEEITESIVRPKSTWQQVIDLAKWTSFLVGAATFLTLLLDWQYTVALYHGLGARGLASIVFVQNPIHTAGVRLVTVIAGCTAYQVVPFLYVYQRWLRKRLECANPRLVMRLGWLSLFLIQISIILTFAFVDAIFPISTGTLIRLVLFPSVVPAALFAWLCFRDHYAESQRFLNILIIAIGGVLFFFGCLTDFPQSMGRRAAVEILLGERSFQRAMVTTKKRFFVSNQVSVFQRPDGLWTHQAEIIAIPGTDLLVPSLQFMGADENTMYLLDFGVPSVHNIPKDAVSELVLFSADLEPLVVLPDAEIPMDWISPVPSPSPQPSN
jgi:hypothetical protein